MNCFVSDSKMADKSYLDKKKDVLDFFKEAFCIDGEAEFVDKHIEVFYCIKLTDSKRGVFYIAHAPETEDNTRLKGMERNNAD